MSFFALKNLVSKTVEPCVPWKFVSAAPQSVRGKDGKKARDAWINNIETAWQVYSSFEGVIANQRLSSPKGADEGNAPLKLHAFVVDIDAPVSEDELAASIGRLGDFIPNYYEKTLSGNARLLWIFEKPVSFPNRRFAVEFLTLALAKVKFDQFPAFDKPAFLEPNRYFTNSGDWKVCSETARIPFALLEGWIVEVSSKHHWRKDRGAVDIPLPIVASELAKKYPTFVNWSGDFAEGAQGPTFWIDGSSSPKSAVVKPTGLFTFSGHAPKPFFSWADLLGAAFVEKYAAELMGKAVDGIYHDGKNYWRRDGYGDWKCFTKEDVASHLSVDRGLSTVKDGGVPNEVSRALQHIQNWQGIAGAAPFVYQPTGIIVKNGFKFLNTHTRRVLSPSADKPVWGPAGGFPFLSGFLDGLFDTKDQLPYFLAWLSRFYRGAHEFSLESGHNVFLLGPPGIGKTLLSQGILNRLMGGSADAEDYLLGETQFNSDLFEVGLWTVDDNSATVDTTSHRKFSAMVKKMAANTTFSYHAKFRVPVSIDWLGRVVVTANDDEESARIVPDLSISILDKLMLFRAAPVAAVAFPPRGALLRTLDEELPFLARFLLEYQVPEALVGTSRFGIRPYHHPLLKVTAEQSSRTAGFAEIIDDWRQAYFSENKALKHWEGTGFQLLKLLHADEAVSRAGLRTLSNDAIGRHLASLKAKGFPIEAHNRGEVRVWKILRPADAAPGVVLPVGTKFSKPSPTSA